ncbi:hypothetical protein MKQ70_26195 [Chitinophaga sedimenti]|uniref:hypothetical protein n=1 Tax=Chitinophaga sedimenti TaxID=2033606 RepID=UPI002006B9E2|nr:hypothetical protein [Chitinophaga sedimenti]MCK7558303.1 hypothetical protein [Chitinophaga sedimenti]
MDVAFSFPLKLIAGATYSDVYQVDEGVKSRPMLTEKIMGTGAPLMLFAVRA